MSANPDNRELSLEVAVTDKDRSGTEYHGNRVRLLCIIRQVQLALQKTEGKRGKYPHY